jgi:hypothetical protein
MDAKKVKSWISTSIKSNLRYENCEREEILEAASRIIFQRVHSIYVCGQSRPVLVAPGKPERKRYTIT